MKRFINKNALAAFTLVAIMSIASAHAAELTSPVSIEQVGKMKIVVGPNSKLNCQVIIYDGENNIIHSETISNKKLFSFTNLADGKYRMDILDARKNMINTKSFTIQTEIKRDLVAIQ